MNMKFLKKFLAVTLAASLMIAPAVTAGATTDASQSSGSESTASSGDSSTPAAPAVTATSSVAGVGASTVAGAYSVKTLPGVAVKAAAATIAQQAGLQANEKVFARVYDINAKGSPLAFKSINAAIAGVGGTFVGALNFDFGKMAGGKFAALPEGVEVPVAFGVPAAFAGKKIGVVKVAKGGVTTILEDQDDNPNSVTVPVSGGLAAYALFAY